MSGVPLTSTRTFGLSSVSGRSRVPFPAASTTACMFYGSVGGGKYFVSEILCGGTVLAYLDQNRSPRNKRKFNRDISVDGLAELLRETEQDGEVTRSSNADEEYDNREVVAK